MSRLRIVAPALLLLAAAGAGLLLLAEDGPEPAALPAPPPATAPAPEPPSGEPAVRPAAGPDTITVTPYGGDGDAAHTGPPLLLVEVLGPDGRGVPGARVRCLEPDATSDDRAFSLEGFPDVVADGRGACRVRAVPERPFRLSARAPGLAGGLDVEPGTLVLPARLTLRLEPVRSVEVLVLDGTGQPLSDAFVRVGPTSLPAGPTGWTGADGRLALELDALLPGEVLSREGFQPTAVLDTGTFSCDPVPWAEEGPTRATIRAERGVTLRVSVVDPDGRPSPARRTLAWERRSTSPRRPPRLHVMGAPIGTYGRFARTFEGSEVRISGLRPDGTVALTLKERGRCRVEREVRLPPGSSEHAVTLVEGPAAPRIEIPVLGPAGAPAAHRTFHVKIDYETPVGETGTLVVLAGERWRREGRVAADVRGRVTRFVRAGRAGKLSLRFFDAALPTAGQGPALLHADFPPLDPGAVLELGPAHLPELETIVAGRVVDGSGGGVPDALVLLARGPDAGSARTAGGHLFTRCTARSGPDGCFAVSGEEPPRGYVVYARRGASISAARPFRGAEGDLTLELRPCGSLSGTLRSAHPDERVEVRLIPRSDPARLADGSAHPCLDLEERVADDGSFRFAPLLPGSYEARVTVGGYEVLAVRDVVVPAGAHARDGRLDGVTVGDDLERGRVLVRTADARPLAGALVRARVHGGPEAPRIDGRTGDDGRTTVLVPAGARASVSVEKQGWLDWRADDVSFPLDVTLRIGRRLVVDVQGTAALAEDDSREYEVELTRRSEEEGAGTPLVRSAALDPGTGRAEFVGLPPGVYGVEVRALRVLEIGGGGVSVRLRDSEAGPLSLGEVRLRHEGTGQRATFRLSAGQVARLRGS